MKLTVLTAADIRQAIPMPEAVAAMKRAFSDLSGGRVVMPQRLAVPVAPADGTLLVKPAYVKDGGLGAKLVSFFPRNAESGKAAITGIVILLDPATGEPVALLDGTFVTAWRTGAASGAATDLLARKDARVGALFGCGAQARTQILAIDAVRSLKTIRVYDPAAGAAARFIEEMAPQVKATLVRAADPREAAEGADVICTATTSATPVFEGNCLTPGVHVNGVGSFTPRMQEVDIWTVERSSVFVDSRQAALTEAGDLIIATRAGVTEPGVWTEIGDVVSGSKPGRTAEDQITFFKSVGVAVQDIAASTLALERATQLGLGRTVEV
jgi:ornithine cyclodeaminase